MASLVVKEVKALAALGSRLTDVVSPPTGLQSRLTGRTSPAALALGVPDLPSLTSSLDFNVSMEKMALRPYRRNVMAKIPDRRRGSKPITATWRPRRSWAGPIRMRRVTCRRRRWWTHWTAPLLGAPSKGAGFIFGSKRDMKTLRDVFLGIRATSRNTEMAQSSKTLSIISEGGERVLRTGLKMSRADWLALLGRLN